MLLVLQTQTEVVKEEVRFSKSSETYGRGRGNRGWNHGHRYNNRFQARGTTRGIVNGSGNRCMICESTHHYVRNCPHAGNQSVNLSEHCDFESLENTAESVNITLLKEVLLWEHYEIFVAKASFCLSGYHCYRMYENSFWIQVVS